MKHQTVGQANRHPSHRACGHHHTYQAQADTADEYRCGLSVEGHQQDEECRTLQANECESAVQTCAEASEPRTGRGVDAQMGEELVHGQGILTGSVLLDDRAHLDAEHDQEGQEVADEQAPPVEYCGHPRVQADQFYQ